MAPLEGTREVSIAKSGICILCLDSRLGGCQKHGGVVHLLHSHMLPQYQHYSSYETKPDYITINVCPWC